MVIGKNTIKIKKEPIILLSIHSGIRDWSKHTQLPMIPFKKIYWALACKALC